MNIDIYAYAHSLHAHTYMYIYIVLHAHNAAFVARFTTEELPHHMKKHIEDDLQEWEENLCKVAAQS